MIQYLRRFKDSCHCFYSAQSYLSSGRLNTKQVFESCVLKIKQILLLTPRLKNMLFFCKKKKLSTHKEEMMVQWGMHSLFIRYCILFNSQFIFGLSEKKKYVCLRITNKNSSVKHREVAYFFRR